MPVTVNHICSCLMLTMTMIALAIGMGTVDWGRKWVDMAPSPTQKMRFRVGVLKLCTLIDGLEEQCDDLEKVDGYKTLYQGGRLALAFGLLGFFFALFGIICVILMAVDFRSLCFSNLRTRKKVTMALAIIAGVCTTLNWVLYAAIVFPSSDWKKARIGTQEFKYDISWSFWGQLATTIMTFNAAGLIAGEEV